MKNAGAKEKFLRAKIAGGASMFNFSDKSMNMDIGDRNAKTVKEILQKLSIPIDSEDTGGNKGRTVIFDTVTGILYVKTIGEGIKEI